MEPFVYETDKAIVTIHPGNLSADERRKVLEAAAKQFAKSILKEGKVELK